ncbi:MAG TPA: secretin N-terminal domain-containing protein [Thermoanaerobaculia bacterium]|nr:secretin N-terminal domain-containing protein [Thermoanaerobaculia bacterium]
MGLGLGPRGFRTLTALVAVVVLVTGCTGFRAARRAEIASQSGNWDDAVLHWTKALEEEPNNIAFQGNLLRARVRASQEHFKRGKEFHDAGILERAMIEYQQAAQLDQSNQYAQVELQRVREELAAARAGTDVETIAEMKRRSQGIRPQPPLLNPRSDEPISLEFPEPVPITSIYRSLGKAFGINVLFDPALKDVELPIVLKDVTAQDALEILMRAAGHFYKVLDPQTIMIAADTPQNRRNYEDLVIQSFFLSNADVKEALTVLRSLIGARQIAMNEQLNAIILRDTADKVKVAEKIIETIDKAKAEVVIDVELLQLSTNKIRDLGAQLSTYSVTQSLDLGSENAVLHLSDLQFLNQSNWALTIPNVVYNFVKTDTDAQLLAQPKLRISEGEKARLVIGDRVPIPVTSFNTSATVGSNIVPITSFQYQDVGITINIEPRVHHNREVTLKLTVEVSQVTGQVSAGSGQAPQPIIGTRTIESTIRLKDGETNLLAGLIRRDDAATDSGVPGLSDIPVLGRLFSKNNTENRRTDVILTLTPHIVRLPDITETDLLPIWVGTEQNITFRGGSPRVESDVEGPFDGGEAASPEEIRERIRERLQSLPRGLQGDEPPEQQPLSPGQELVPGLPPPSSSIFDEEEEEEELPLPEFFEEEGEQPPAVMREQAALDFVVEELVAETTRLAAATDEAAAFGRFAAVTASPLATATDVVLRMVPAEVAVAVGDSFELALTARALAPLSHLPVTLVFDPAVVAVERVEAGPFLGGPGAAEVLSDRSQPGRLVLGASRLGESVGVAGEGVIARVVFRAVGPGSAGLRFERARALDAGLRPLALDTRPAAVEVGGERPAAPEPPERPIERPRPPVAEAKKT